MFGTRSTPKTAVTLCIPGLFQMDLIFTAKPMIWSSVDRQLPVVYFSDNKSHLQPK